MFPCVTACLILSLQVKTTVRSEVIATSTVSRVTGCWSGPAAWLHAASPPLDTSPSCVGTASSATGPRTANPGVAEREGGGGGGRWTPHRCSSPPLDIPLQSRRDGLSSRLDGTQDFQPSNLKQPDGVGLGRVLGRFSGMQTSHILTRKTVFKFRKNAGFYWSLFLRCSHRSWSSSYPLELLPWGRGAFQGADVFASLSWRFWFLQTGLDGFPKLCGAPFTHGSRRADVPNPSGRT